jgi:hypothetical protein
MLYFTKHRSRAGSIFPIFPFFNPPSLSNREQGYTSPYAAKTGYRFGNKCHAIIKSGNRGFTMLFCSCGNVSAALSLSNTTPFVLGSRGITCKIPFWRRREDYRLMSSSFVQESSRMARCRRTRRWAGGTTASTPSSARRGRGSTSPGPSLST